MHDNGTHPLNIPIAELTPNNWYINRDKLNSIRKAWKQDSQNTLPPVLVSIIDGTYSLIDGHSRTYAAWETDSL